MELACIILWETGEGKMPNRKTVGIFLYILLERSELLRFGRFVTGRFVNGRYVTVRPT